MLRLFQVNEGRYLDVEAELTPNSRSREVVGGEEGKRKLSVRESSACPSTVCAMYRLSCTNYLRKSSAGKLTTLSRLQSLVARTVEKLACPGLVSACPLRGHPSHGWPSGVYCLHPNLLYSHCV